jgi:menaquinol-cytochrome c reductase cytochrome b/c subunit
MEEGKKSPNQVSAQTPDKAIAIVDPNSEGYEIYKRSSCIQCHAIDLKGQPRAKIPALLGIGDSYDKEQMVVVMKEGIGIMGPQWNMNLSSGLTESDLDKLADWLVKQKQ